MEELLQDGIIQNENSAEDLSSEQDTSAVQTDTDERAKTEVESFTKAELDMIIQRRLQEEESKLNALQQKLENQYKEKEFRLLARDTLLNNGLSTELIEYIPVQDKESLDKIVGIINEICDKKAHALLLESYKGSTPPANNGNNISASEPLKKAWGLG